MPRGKLEFGLYGRDGQLEPRRYSSGKTQIDLIEEIIEAFRGNDIVFLRGTVGSGKSAVGLRTILEFGRGIVSVPTKVLSDQYAASYEGDKYFLKDDGKRAEIGILKGRRNFRCPYQAGRGREISCDNRALPCKRPVDWKHGEKRIDALRECPCWGFIFPSGLADSIKGARKVQYEGIKGKWTWCMKGECPYWKQFQAYVSSDAIVMNSAKWAAELSVGRLPEVPITVVDEADHWLDSLAVKVSVTERTISWLQEEVRRSIESSGLDEDSELEDRGEVLRDLWSDAISGKGDPLKLAEYLVELLDEIDETSGELYWKLMSVLEHKGHVEWDIQEKGIAYFVPDPKIVFQGIRDKMGCKWLLMSATVQDKVVLKDIFGIEPTLVEGETRFPGKLLQRRLGSEEVINYRKWADDSFKRKYWAALRKIMRRAKRPSFIPVHAHAYLPPRLREEVRKSGDAYNQGGIMFTTKMDRGADLKGIKSIILLKFPYPAREDPLLKGMERRLGSEAFRRYYRDIAGREFVQQIGRVLRTEDDVAEFWSLDNMCHVQLRRLWKGSVSSQQSLK
ncbi:MAG: helicase C-terminal domain-containing protein [Candidatus Hodarchaeaceae archaeon]|nr:helicase C-terminal domain-containing protein [Candidatus Hodarchaeaceae archaeon]